MFLAIFSYSEMIVLIHQKLKCLIARGRVPLQILWFVSPFVANRIIFRLKRDKTFLPRFGLEKKNFLGVGCQRKIEFWIEIELEFRARRRKLKTPVRITTGV